MMVPYGGEIGCGERFQHVHAYFGDNTKDVPPEHIFSTCQSG